MPTKTGEFQKAEPNSKPTGPSNRKSDWRKNQYHAQSEKTVDQFSDRAAVSNSKETNGKTPVSNTNASSMANVRCYECKEFGHKASFHRKNASAMQACINNGDAEENEYDKVIAYQRQFIIPCFVNNISVKAIRDSGANISIIQERFVRPDQFLDNTSVLVKGVFDQRQPLKMARIELHVPTLMQDPVQFNVAVARDIESTDILIGNDLFTKFPEMTDILREKGKASDTLINPDKSNMRVNPVVEAHGMNGSLLIGDSGACSNETEQEDNIPSIMITTRRKNYLPRSNTGDIGKRPLPVNVETFDRQRADTSATAGSGNTPVGGIDNVINSAKEGLITETNRSPPGVKEG